MAAPTAESTSNKRPDGVQGNTGRLYDELMPTEKWWSDRYDLFERHGYRLRPRYRPGWVPSWQGTAGLKRERCEDSVKLMAGLIMDATRVKDGVCVMIKRVEASSDEVAICRMLSSPERRKDPHNHAVPILDYFAEGGESPYAFLVMPLLRSFDDPPFSNVSEVIDFIRQMLQGMIYLHDLNIAHRDCYLGNIMMDASVLIPEGFHPQDHAKTYDFSRDVKPLRRCDLKEPVQYYFIDFGVSSWFRDPKNVGGDASEGHKPADKSLRRLVKGGICQDKLAPELNSRHPYDPFLLDICILGDVILEAFTDKYSNLHFLLPLANRMSNSKPDRRPTEEEALQFFEEIVATQGSIARRWRLKSREEKLIPAAIRDVQAAASEVKYQVQRISSHVFGSIRRKKIE